STARPELSDFAPRITTIKINPEKIRDIIGKGGAVIRKLQDDFQVNINVQDDGTVQIASADPERTKGVLDAINGITKEVELGALYMGKVTRIMGFGCFANHLLVDLAAAGNINHQVTQYLGRARQAPPWQHGLGAAVFLLYR
ncbi:MAG: hypothetical protein JZU63_11860, partial [Rhodoferax sp.]|nr:hypothetical protein [Rhodoferax sp.]